MHYLTFIVLSLIYQLVYIVSYRKDDCIKSAECCAKWILYYSITVEIVVVINYLRIFDDVYFTAFLGNIILTEASARNGWGMRQSSIIVIVVLCVIYQVLYFVIKGLKR